MSRRPRKSDLSSLLPRGGALLAFAVLISSGCSAPAPPQPGAVAGGKEELRPHDEPTADLEAVLADLRSARRQDPSKAGIRFEEGRVLHRMGRLEEAVAAWNAALTLDPEHGPTHARLAAALYQRGEVPAARHHLDAARAAGAATPSALSFLLGETDLPPITVDTAGTERGPRAEPPVRVDRAPAGVQTAETSIVASRDGELLATWGDTRVAEDGGTWRIGYAVSLDHGATWHEGLLQSPAAESGAVVFEADPATAWDPRTGRFWAGGISFISPPEIFAAGKPPGALDFEPSVRIRNNEQLADKGFLAAGPAPGDPDSTLLHFVDRRGLHTSRDLGETWSELLFLGNLQGPLPRVGPRGELYIGFWNGLDGVQLIRSLDGGATVHDRTFIARRLEVWDNTDGSRFPGRFRVPPLPYLAVDPVDGTLYCVYFDTRRRSDGAEGSQAQSEAQSEAQVDLFFTRSEDGGDSWLPPRPIPFGAAAPSESTAERADQFFPWLEVDPLGRLHMVFYDTREVAQTDDQENAHVDVYYAWSGDRGESWTEIRLTEEPFETGDIRWTAPEGQFLGDYLGLAVAGDSVHPLYAVAEDGDLDIWTRRIDFRAEGTPSEPPPPPRGLRVEAVAATEARLVWEPTGPGTSVMVEIRSPLTDGERKITASPGATSTVVSGLDPRRVYTFRIATRSVAGVSPWSEPVTAAPVDTRAEACEPGGDVLCLLDGRFRVKAIWRDFSSGGDGVGHPVPVALEADPGATEDVATHEVSNNTGTFWFFDLENLELVVKVLDGTPVNGAHWVFYSALTHVEYWLTVVDTQTGVPRTYHSPAASRCGRGDTRAFPGPGFGGSSRASTATAPRPELEQHRPEEGPATETARTHTTDGGLDPQPGCEPGDTVLCLQGHRFRIEVSWRDPRSGDTGVGHVIPATEDSAFFWFFDPDNVELLVKMIDGRRVNGGYWFFAGGLSDVETTITVVDTLRGTHREYRNDPASPFCNQVDTGTF